MGPVEGTKFDILKLLAKQELSSQQMAESLGVSAAAVRQHLDTLEALGLVTRRKQITQPSRPTFLYRLSARGADAFPKRYDLLLSLVVDVILERQGRDAVTGLIEAAAERLAERVEPRFRTADERTRWTLLLDWLEEELEWQADVTDESEGRHRITIYQCPFREVSSREPMVCAVFFRTLIRALYGDVPVDPAATKPTTACCALVVGRDATRA